MRRSMLGRVAAPLADAAGGHHLPGLPFAPPDPTSPAVEVVPAHFASYERRFALGVHVTAVRDVAPALLVETDRGTWRTAR